MFWINFLKIESPENYFGKHWYYCRFLWVQGWVWEVPSLVPTKHSLQQMLPILVFVFSPASIANRGGTIKFSHNAVRRCCLHVFQIHPHANSSKIVHMGIISNAYIFAESPKFIKICLRLQLVGRLRKTSSCVKVYFITGEWISDPCSSLRIVSFYSSQHICVLQTHKVKVFQFFYPK